MFGGFVHQKVSLHSMWASPNAPNESLWTIRSCGCADFTLITWIWGSLHVDRSPTTQDRTTWNNLEYFSVCFIKSLHLLQCHVLTKRYLANVSINSSTWVHDSLSKIPCKGWPNRLEVGRDELCRSLPPFFMCVLCWVRLTTSQCRRFKLCKLWECIISGFQNII